MQPFLPSPDQIKVLVVDDEPKHVGALRKLLETEGYQTVSASDGSQAIEQVKAESPDLILLDVRIPAPDGFEVCQRIKTNPATLFVPVVLVTGLTNRSDRVKGAQAGADDFITKPPDPQELLTRVKSLTRVKALHDALQASNERLRRTVEERSRQLEQTTAELQQLLEQKAHFTPGLVPTAHDSLPTQDDHGADSHGADDPTDEQALKELKQSIMARLASTLEGRTDLSRTPEMVSLMSERLAAIYDASGLQLPEHTRKRLFREVVDDILGYGPIEPLLGDDDVSEVMVNGPHQIYVERAGHLLRTDIRFDDDDHVLRIIDRIVRPLGRRVDRKTPTVDARLPDGSRVNAVIPPCAIDGPSITIRKFTKNKLTVDDLIKFGSITPQMAEFLRACVGARLNILVAGGTGSGKTTLLNVLSSFIPSRERIVTIEDSAELQLHQEHVVRLETKPPDLDGTGQVAIRDLVKNSLRMLPDRIVVGEVRGGEALDMLQAMNTGHDGGMTTIHANSPRDAVARLETLVLMAGLDLPLHVARSQIASALDLIVQQARLEDGSRRVTQVSAVEGMESGVVVISDIFALKETNRPDGSSAMEIHPTGIRPKFMHKLETAGFSLDAGVFMPPNSMRRPDGRSHR
ncbi:MAG: Flp pilus assembly complex ATPase component TadA [Chloroflexi bacterium]|nr:Flp pilus assembly complex ATPase component TadA [Chloroflexota bacterium]